MELAAFYQYGNGCCPPDGMVQVAFYCSRKAVHIRDGVTLVTLTQCNFIYIRDTVVFVELLLNSSSSHGGCAKTSRWTLAVRHHTKVSRKIYNASCIFIQDFLNG
jgi:hypothetical protein